MLIPAIAVSFCVTILLMIALRPAALSVGLVDMPGGRKQHIGAVPMIGGIAMWAGLAVGMLLLGGAIAASQYLVAAGALLVTVGVLDDKFPLPATVRLAAQLSAVLIMFFGADLRMDTLGNPFGFGEIQLGSVSLLFTILIAVSVINAFNLVDGADGLAGTLGLLALGPVAIIAGYQSAPGMAAIIAMAVTIGFLLFNFPTIHNRRVRTFLGDAGSTLIGLLVVTVTTAISHGEAAIVSPVICLWFAAIPIFDLFTCFVRRVLKRRSPFTPGRDHFHHVLARSGLGVRKTLGVLTGFQAIFALIGLVGYYAGTPDVVMFLAWAALGLSHRFVLRRFASAYRLDRRRQRVRPTRDEPPTRRAA